MGKFGNLIKKGLVAIALLYGLFVVLLLWFESQLVFPGAPVTRGNYRPDFEFEDVNFESADGTQLHGWMIPFQESERYLLYCHGNAENVAMTGNGFAFQLGQVMQANVLVFDYRGYGKSEGKPNEAGVLADTDAAMDWICDRFNVQSSDVMVLGLSLGGGPAVDVATRRGCKGLIAIRTYSSVVDVAADRFPWVPVGRLMKNRFESAKKIANYHGPFLQSHGGSDRVIPFKFGQRLHAACPSPDKAFFSKDSMNHFSPLHPEFLQMASDFADRIYDAGMANDG